jgi:hypothetical protein
MRLIFYNDASPTDFAAFASFARQKIQTPIAPNDHRKMILARRSSPAPSARHICRTKTKIKFQPRRGGIFCLKFLMMSLLTEL